MTQPINTSVWTCPYCPFTTDDVDAGLAHIAARESGTGCIHAEPANAIMLDTAAGAAHAARVQAEAAAQADDTAEQVPPVIADLIRAGWTHDTTTPMASPDGAIYALHGPGAVVADVFLAARPGEHRIDVSGLTDGQVTAAVLATTDPAKPAGGPWLAILADTDGFVYPTIADAIDSLGEEEEVYIAVVCGTAVPNDRDGTTGVLLRRPGSHACGDVAAEIECYLIDPDDESMGAAVRWAQAQAMAAGLNAAGTPALPAEVQRLREEMYAQKPVIEAVQAWAEVIEDREAPPAAVGPAVDALYDAVEGGEPR